MCKMGRFRILFVFTLSISLSLFFLWLFFYYPKEIRIYAEHEIYSKRETGGKFWNIIENDETRRSIADVLGIEIPNINFDESYLLLADGRRIRKIVYKRISKYSWEYDVPKGEAVFEREHNLHTIYLYKINKVMLKQEGD